MDLVSRTRSRDSRSPIVAKEKEIRTFKVSCPIAFEFNDPTCHVHQESTLMEFFPVRVGDSLCESWSYYQNLNKSTNQRERVLPMTNLYLKFLGGSVSNALSSRKIKHARFADLVDMRKLLSPLIASEYLG